jgi:lipoprotein-anchoring transpeptidase ErfK/SrfK
MKASMLVTRRRVVLGIAASSFLISDRTVLAAGVATIKALKPGEFIWRPEVSPRGPVVIVVSLPEQLVHVYRNGVTIGVSTCSTGKVGNRTPTGVFTILQKRAEH